MKHCCAWVVNVEASAQWLAPLAVVTGIALMAGAGIVYKDDIKALLHAFIRVVDRCGPSPDSATQRRLRLTKIIVARRLWLGSTPRRGLLSSALLCCARGEVKRPVLTVCPSR